MRFTPGVRRGEDIMTSVLTRNGRLRVWVVPTLIALIVVCAAAAMLIGRFSVSLEDVVAALHARFWGGPAVPPRVNSVVFDLRAPRIIVAILIGRFGTHFHLVTYTTMSANLMLREIGLVLFLASVGIDAGANFVQTVVEGDGLLYVGCGFLITVIPLLIIGAIARLYYKVNYFTLMGLIAGSNTDPPALAYANQTTSGDAPAVGYSTVYPLSMFLRILTGQMILLAMM